MWRHRLPAHQCGAAPFGLTLEQRQRLERVGRVVERLAAGLGDDDRGQVPALLLERGARERDRRLGHGRVGRDGHVLEAVGVARRVGAALVAAEPLGDGLGETVLVDALVTPERARDHGRGDRLAVDAGAAGAAVDDGVGDVGHAQHRAAAVDGTRPVVLDRVVALGAGAGDDDLVGADPALAELAAVTLEVADGVAHGAAPVEPVEGHQPDVEAARLLEQQVHRRLHPVHARDAGAVLVAHRARVVEHEQHVRAVLGGVGGLAIEDLGVFGAGHARGQRRRGGERRAEQEGEGWGSHQQSPLSSAAPIMTTPWEITVAVLAPVSSLRPSTTKRRAAIGPPIEKPRTWARPP